jgi:hypothetical protein
MPKISIDYSNTVFYKIYCKDINFHDVYIGHTTNFVQRKHSHKRACNKSSHNSYNLKVYKIIRQHGGWDNWNMEIIGFKNCKDHSEACSVEQKYFDSYEASLNSILAKKQIVERLPVAKDKLNLYCEVCKINCDCKKSFERHKKTKKHELALKAQSNCEMPTPQRNNYFSCVNCHFECRKKSDYNRHIVTAKHKKMTSMSTFYAERTNSSSLQYVCYCGKSYKSRQSLYRHRRSCTVNTEPLFNQNTTYENNNSNSHINNDTVNAILQDNLEMRKALVQQSELYQQQMKEQQEQHNKQIQELIPKLQQVTTINNNSNK